MSDDRNRVSALAASDQAWMDADKWLDEGIAAHFKMEKGEQLTDGELLAVLKLTGLAIAELFFRRGDRPVGE